MIVQTPGSRAQEAMTDADSVVALVEDGDLVALPSAFSGSFSAAAMSITRALIRRGVRRLHLLGVPALGFQADLLIGAGCVSTVESGSILLYEYGPARRFVTEQKAGTIAVKESTCPAIHAGLIAAEKGLPFLPVRGIIGSDILAHREAMGDWKVVDNPFGDDDPIVLVKALQPDVALFHAPLADAHGNVWVGERAELNTMARAARKVLVSFETLYEGNLLDDDRMAAATLPAVFVTALSHQPNGSWPLDGGASYDEDAGHLREYAQLSATREGFARYVERHVLALPVSA
jgi:glutaconate CoA-transferase subunit A